MTADTVVLHCGAHAAPLRIAPGSGTTYSIIARNASACGRLVHEALRSPHAELVPRSGGLLVNLSVLENVVLPAVYHGRVTDHDIAELAYREFEACGLGRAQADALCEREVPELSAFERRLVALVRSLLMRPSVLLLERISEGLNARDVARVADFAGYYRRAVASGTLVLFDLAGMPWPEIAADVRVEEE